MVSATLIAILKRRRERLVIARKWYNHLYGNVKRKTKFGLHPINKKNEKNWANIITLYQCWNKMNQISKNIFGEQIYIFSIFETKMIQMKIQ